MAKPGLSVCDLEKPFVLLVTFLSHMLKLSPTIYFSLNHVTHPTAAFPTVILLFSNVKSTLPLHRGPTTAYKVINTTLDFFLMQKCIFNCKTAVSKKKILLLLLFCVVTFSEQYCKCILPQKLSIL